MWKKGLVSVSFRSLEIDEIIKLTKEAGLDTIEWGSDVHAPCDDFQKLNILHHMIYRFHLSNPNDSYSYSFQ